MASTEKKTVEQLKEQMKTNYEVFWETLGQLSTQRQAIEHKERVLAKKQKREQDKLQKQILTLTQPKSNDVIITLQVQSNGVDIIRITPYTPCKLRLERDAIYFQCKHQYEIWSFSQGSRRYSCVHRDGTTSEWLDHAILDDTYPYHRSVTFALSKTQGNKLAKILTAAIISPTERDYSILRSILQSGHGLDFMTHPLSQEEWDTVMNIIQINLNNTTIPSVFESGRAWINGTYLLVPEKKKRKIK